MSDDLTSDDRLRQLVILSNRLRQLVILSNRLVRRRRVLMRVMRHPPEQRLKR